MGLASSPDDNVIAGKECQVLGATVKCHFPNMLPSQPCSGTGQGETPDLMSEAFYPSGVFSGRPSQNVTSRQMSLQMARGSKRPPFLERWTSPSFLFFLSSPV